MFSVTDTRDNKYQRFSYNLIIYSLFVCILFGKSMNRFKRLNLPVCNMDFFFLVFYYNLKQTRQVAQNVRES